MFEDFAILVAALAIVYALVSKYIQNKLIDRKEMEAIQSESKSLSQEFEKAKKANDKKWMDQVMQKQMEFLPKMNKLMFSQFKPMVLILLVFFAASWVVGEIDPSLKDDVKIDLFDDGKGCDKIAGDGIFSACYQLNNSNFGKWTVLGRTLKNDGSEVGQNTTHFIHKDGEDDGYREGPKGEPMAVSTDKQKYENGELVQIYVQTKDSQAKKVEAKLDNGTYFKVNLPVTIPLVVFNLRYIIQSYWWFIFVSVISNLLISIASSTIHNIEKKGISSQKEGKQE